MTQEKISNHTWQEQAGLRKALKVKQLQKTGCRMASCTHFPSWVMNWDYEIGSDEDDVPAVWITLYADERAILPDQLGKGASEMIRKFRSALMAAGIRRWPYIRMRTAREHKAG